jgi:hypothetical protein
LSQFSDTYREYEASMARYSEIDTIVPVLTELKETFAKVNGLEEILQSDRIEDIEEAFCMVNSLDSTIKTRGLPLSIIPQLKSQIDLLTIASRDKIKDQWNKSISITKAEAGDRLFILDDIKGISRPLRVANWTSPGMPLFKFTKDWRS